MLACVVVTAVFALFLVLTIFVRRESLAQLADAGKLEGMEEAVLLDQFGIPVRREPEGAAGREALEFGVPNGRNVRVVVDVETRLVVGAARVGADTTGSPPDGTNP